MTYRLRLRSGSYHYQTSQFAFWGKRIGSIKYHPTLRSWHEARLPANADGRGE